MPARPSDVRLLVHGAQGGSAETTQGPVCSPEAGAALHDAPSRGWACAILEAWERLDGARLRASRGWRTARQCDGDVVPATAVVDRSAFYNAARCAIARAVRDSSSKRGRRLAVRAAILEVMQRFGVLQVSRGGVPVLLPEAEGIS